MPTETPENENTPVPVCDSIEEQINAFAKRFDALMEEAQQYGFTTVVGICAHDVMDMQGWRSYARKGNFYAAIGMINMMLDEFTNE